jgi:antitoxin (DNA-binding transcriptional repressor) of toxin-antitoxin stability system
MVALGRLVRWRIVLAILGGAAFACQHLTRMAVAQVASGAASPDSGPGIEVTLDAELVAQIVAGERRLAAAIRTCSGEITRNRIALAGVATNAPNRADGNQQHLRFGIRNGSARAEFLVGAPGQLTQVLLATPGGSYRLLPFESGNGINGVLTAYNDPAAPEVLTTLEADVIGVVGALLMAPGPKGSDYLATNKGPITRHSSELVPNGISIKSSFDGGADEAALPSGKAVLRAADFEMVLDAEHDYAVRFFRSKTVLPGATQEIERRISLTSSRDGSFVPNAVSTRIVMIPVKTATDPVGFEETSVIDFDDSPPLADTFTRAWIDKLAGNVRVDEVDRNGTPVPHPLPVLPIDGPDPDQRAIEPRVGISPWLLVNVAILATLAVAWFIRRRSVRK